MVVFFLFNLGFLCKVFTIIFTAIAFSQYKYLLKENSTIRPIPVKNVTVKKKEKERKDL